jgi:hypothetical protein
VRDWAGTGNSFAARRWNQLLLATGDLEQLKSRAGSHDHSAADALANWLAAQTESQREARPELDNYSQSYIISGFTGRPSVKIAKDLARINSLSYAHQLARMLSDKGRLSREIVEARAQADGGDKEAGALLAALLAVQDEMQELRARADAGDFYAERRLAEVLVIRRDEDGLRARADAGDLIAARRLEDILTASEDIRGLVARSEAGDSSAGSGLVLLLTDRQDLDGLRARADAGDSNAASMLARILVFRHDIDGLRRRAEAGDRHAAYELLQTPSALRDKRAIEQEVTAGNTLNVRRIANIWHQPGANSAEYQQRLRQGLVFEGSIEECLNGVSEA